MERVVVVGPGAMGLLLAAKCAEAGVPVRLIDYRPDRVAKLNANGITIIDPAGRSRTYPVPCTTEGGGRDPASHVFLAVKAYDTPRALTVGLEALSPRGVVVSLQNGIQHVAVIREHAPAARTVFGTTAHGATRLSVGKVRHCGEGDTLIAAEAHNEGEAEGVAALLSRMGLRATVVRDLPFTLWRKLLFNAAINPVTALLGIRNGQIPRLPGAWEVAAACFREAREIAAATVGPEIGQVGDEDLREVCERTAENLSSMLQDLRSGKRTEIRALNGTVVSEAARLGRNAPVNDVMVKLISAMEEARR